MADINRVPQNCGYDVIPIQGYQVASWTPQRDGRGKSEMVVIEYNVPGMKLPLLLRFKSRKAVQTMIDSLTFHMNDVFPVVDDAN